MTRKIRLRTNAENLKSRGITQEFSSYPQLKPRLVFDSEDAMKEYMKSKEVNWLHNFIPISGDSENS